MKESDFSFYRWMVLARPTLENGKGIKRRPVFSFYFKL
jgi:hypothetical protein